MIKLRGLLSRSKGVKCFRLPAPIFAIGMDSEGETLESSSTNHFRNRCIGCLARRSSTPENLCLRAMKLNDIQRPSITVMLTVDNSYKSVEDVLGRRCGISMVTDHVTLVHLLKQSRMNLTKQAHFVDKLIPYMPCYAMSYNDAIYKRPLAAVGAEPRGWWNPRRPWKPR